MRKAFVAVAVLTALAMPAWGGDLGVMASFWSPDDIDDDTRGGVYLDIPIVRLDWQTRVTFYEEMGFSSAAQGEFIIDPTTIDTGLAWTFPTKNADIEPFLGAGFSYVDFKINRGGRIKDEFGWYGNVGLDWNFRGNGSVRGELLYRVLSAEIQGDDLGVSEFAGRFIDEPLDLNGVALNIGIAYHW